MKLHYTPRSHFSRKVRILLGALDVPCELVDAGNAADADPTMFGANPLMKVPTLLDGERVVYESDHIAAYLVRKLDPADRFGVLTSDMDTINARSVMNGVMAAEAELILAERTGMDTSAHRRFDKMRDAIRLGLEWLEARHALFQEQPDYLNFHLVSAWDHLVLYDLFRLEYPRLQMQAARFADIPYIVATKPV